MASKKRYWSFIGYPDSLPENWCDMLVATGLPFAVSPLHDCDSYEDTGELKKPHYHFILAYSGPTTFNSVKAITDSLNQPIPIALESVKGAYDYFSHKNNPEKYQYDPLDIKAYNGFSILDYATPTKSDGMCSLKSILGLIKDNNCTDLLELIEFLLDSELYDVVEYVRSNSYFINQLLIAQYHRAKK